MFKNIILPERYGSYYLFTQARVGLDITKTKVRLAVVEAKGTKRILKTLIDEPIIQDSSQDYEVRAAQALQSALAKVKYYDVISTALPSSKVVFKELIFPFSDYEKIAAIVGFEVEPHLPFPADRAFIDFIITGQKDNETTVLVAAVKKDYVNEHMAFLESAGVEPEKITIDMFELFGLYQRIASYKTLESTVVLIDLGLNSTRLAYIVDGILTSIRMINKGMATLAKTNEDLDRIYQLGLEEEAGLPPAFTRLMQEIQFTISAFKSATPTEEKITLLLFGDGAAIKGIPEQICKNTPYACKPFEIKRLLEDSDISFGIRNSIAPGMIISIATALSSQVTQSFNIMPQTIKQEKLMNKQLIVTGILLASLFIALGAHTFFQLRKLRNEYSASEKQAMNQLKSTLGIQGKNLGLVLDEAKTEIEKAENIWFSLSPQSRTSFLKYLEELSTLIDREGVGLNLKKLSITRDSITLEGSVRDYSALDVFQRELRRSKLFSLEAPLQDPNFKTLRLIISRNSEE